MEKIKPCPFCGCDLEIDDLGFATHPANDCALSDVGDRDVWSPFCMDLRQKEEVEAWNRRVEEV